MQSTMPSVPQPPDELVVRSDNSLGWPVRDQPAAGDQPRGIECQTQQGTVMLPWAAVTRIERTGRMGQSLIAIRVHPQAVPGQNGVEANPQIWAQVVKKGMAFGELGLVPGFGSILPALQHYSQGRVPIG